MKFREGILPPPAAIGLPSKFTEWRNGQEEAILHLQDSDSRIVVQVQPTGSGKSVCYMADAVFSGRTVILTGTKGLQRQLESDFPDVATVMGKNEYRCKLLGGRVSCDFGPCSYGKYCPLRKKSICEYYAAIDIARQSPVVVTNYAFWIKNKPGVLGNIDLLVCDEAHDTVTQLCDSLTVEIYESTFKKARGECGGLSWPLGDDGLWLWAMDSLGVINDYIETQRALRGLDTCLRDKKFKAVYRLKQNLEQLETADEDLWISEHHGRAVSFIPLWPAEFADEYLFRDVPKILMTSATVTKKSLNLLGVNDSNMDYVEYPSQFPVENRPVIWIQFVSACRMDYRASQYVINLWLTRIDQIIRGRLDRKGIIHTVSYKRCNTILSSSEYSEHMITHESGKRDEAIEAFKRADPPAILVSPSVVTGYDFPDDECRYQIIGKLPFPDQRRKVDKERKKIDPEFGMNQAVQNLVQAVGRGTRNKSDYCETFIVDDHISWFIKKFEHLATRSFLESYRRVTTIPAPIEGR